MKGLLIEHLYGNGAASELGIEPGDLLVSINGHAIRDILDYQYWYDGNFLSVQIRKADGSLRKYEVEGDLPLGVVFHPPEPRHCRCNCIFCFVHQLPKGLRRPLYVKDEDYRLSFLYGNYVTLANLSMGDLRRIIRMRLSPLYLSVHATDPDLRQMMLGRTGIPSILELMKKLASSGIRMHTQIVLCPGINDGNHLKSTISDLESLYPHVESIAIVPVGLTIHRERLPIIQPVTKEYAASFIHEWGPYLRKVSRKYGEPILFIADEWYLKAGMPFPPFSSYGNFPQLENGVGMIPLFRKEAARILKRPLLRGKGEATVITGFSALPVLEEFTTGLSEKTGLLLKVLPVTNQLFGEPVTVAGLVSGGDIVKALKGKEKGELVVIPDVMLKEGEGVFLDGMTLEDIERESGARSAVAESSPRGLYQVLKREFGLR